MPSLHSSTAGSLPATAASQRLTNSEATDWTCGFSPAATRRSIPRTYASAAARYCSREKRSVTLIGTPAKIDSSMAGIPAGVPGILMKRLWRRARVKLRRRLDAPGGIVREQGRDLERDPAVDAARGFVVLAEEIGGLDQVL